MPGVPSPQKDPRGYGELISEVAQCQFDELNYAPWLPREPSRRQRSMSAKVLQFCLPDPEFIREFADYIEKLQEGGKVVRTTIVICAVGDTLQVQSYTAERVAHVLGMLELAKVEFLRADGNPNEVNW